MTQQTTQALITQPMPLELQGRRPAALRQLKDTHPIAEYKAPGSTLIRAVPKAALACKPIDLQRKINDFQHLDQASTPGPSISGFGGDAACLEVGELVCALLKITLEAAPAADFVTGRIRRSNPLVVATLGIRTPPFF